MLLLASVLVPMLCGWFGGVGLSHCVVFVVWRCDGVGVRPGVIMLVWWC